MLSRLVAHRCAGRRSQQWEKRGAFTLVEVLTVVIIIGILMGMLFGAFMRARTAAILARMKFEHTQIVTALEDFRTQLGGNEYPPDFSLATPSGQQDLQRSLRAIFPRCPPSNYPTNLTSVGIDPSMALVFWLGGAQDANGNFIGFSADPTNPFDVGTGTVNASRIGPFFTGFDKTRLFSPGLSLNLNNTAATFKLYQFYPLNGKPAPTAANTPGAASPYLYFKAVGGAYGGTWNWMDPNNNKISIQPFETSSGTTTSWQSPTSYQLLSPGLDGQYASPDPKTNKFQQTIDGKAPVYPLGTNYEKAAQGTITNFTGKSVTVGDDVP